MFEEVFMRLECCVVCNKEIKLEKKMVSIYRDEHCECWVHAGDCFRDYKKLLTGPAAIKQGIILGICDYCAKPVRDKQKYLAGRTGRKNENSVGANEDPFLTTIPSNENGHFVSFVHEECLRLANE